MSPRPAKFTFYLDENFPTQAGKFFTQLGHGVIDGKKLLGEGKSDKQHLVEAKKHKAILVAFDRDFLVDDDKLDRVRESQGAILFTATGSKLPVIRTIIRRVLKKATQHHFDGRLCVAGPEEIRFHK